MLGPGRETLSDASTARTQLFLAEACKLSYRSEEETERYIYHRINVAGGRGGLTFSSGAIRLVHREAEGVPRLINLACDRALLAAYVDQALEAAPPKAIAAPAESSRAVEKRCMNGSLVMDERCDASASTPPMRL